MTAISQSIFLHALGWAIINSLWQMGFLWVAYQVILTIFPKIKGGKKSTFANWSVITGFVWFIYTFLSTIILKNEIGFANVISGWTSDSNYIGSLQKIIPVASVIYLTILIIPVWQFLRNYKYVQLIRSKGLHKINVDWRIFVKNTAARMGILRSVQIWLSDIVDTPVTIGFLKPIILIPVAAINNLSIQQTEAIILHELCHIRRFDYLYNIIINVIKTILYFNPFVRLFIKRIEKERENSCDEMVVQFQYQPLEYASALLLLEKTGINRHQMMIAASGKSNDLLTRIETILGIRKTTCFSLKQISFSLATLFLIIIMNVFISTESIKHNNSIFSFNSEINPYYFFNSQNKQQSKTNTYSQLVKNNFSRKNATDKNNLSVSENPDLQDVIVPSDVYNIGYNTAVTPGLEANEEEKVKQTLADTKKILEEKEWKELEKSYADAFNSLEKSKLKNEYSRELNKINWSDVENKIRLSYNNIDWEKVNNQVSTSLAEIKIDSLNHVVNMTLDNLGKLKSMMKETNSNSIPDTDITLKKVTENELKVKAKLEQLKKARIRKIVRI